MVYLEKDKNDLAALGCQRFGLNDKPIKCQTYILLTNLPTDMYLGNVFTYYLHTYLI